MFVADCILCGFDRLVGDFPAPLMFARLLCTRSFVRVDAYLRF